MAKLMQPSLSGGEMAPGLHGRVDVARYTISLKTCRNFITRPTGGAVKRPGFRYRGAVKTGTLATRILPFIYSTEIRYLVEAGNLYFRFWYLDATNALVPLESSPGVPYELVTPYATADLESLRITQSADVLYIVHPTIAPRELRRLTASTFELREYVNRNGPFRPVNTNDGVRAAVSAATGVVTVTCSDPIFLSGHVGALFFVEEPELRDIAPWEPAQRGLVVGDLRRSDGKVYRCTGIKAGGTYNVSGGVRPVHDAGRAWDGSGDTRNDGVNAYTVGVEWEYVHPGYGIVNLTGYTNATTMTGLVVSRVPDGCVGAVAAVRTWTLSGDGVTKTFATAGAVAASVHDYAVTIGSVGVQP